MAIPSPLLAFRYRVGIQMQMGPRWRQKPGTGQWSLQGAKGEGSRNGGDLWPGHLSPHSTKYATAEKPTRRHSVRKRQAQRWSQVVWPHMPASGQGSKSYQFQPNRARIQPRGQANWIGSQEGIHVFNADSKLSDGQGHLCGAWSPPALSSPLRVWRLEAALPDGPGQGQSMAGLWLVLGLGAAAAGIGRQPGRSGLGSPGAETQPGTPGSWN